MSLLLLSELIATSIEEVGVSWFDFYSIGHICFGVGVFLFFSLFYTIPKANDHNPWFPWWLIIVITIAVLIIWEFLENILFIAIGIKFEGRPDSVQNISTDLILGFLGMLVAFLIAHNEIDHDKNIWGYYIFGIISFAIWLVFFFVLRYFTLWYAGIY